MFVPPFGAILAPLERGGKQKLAIPIFPPPRMLSGRHDIGTVLQFIVWDFPPKADPLGKGNPPSPYPLPIGE
ncbi:MAG: hypothetical protein QME51_05460, partial [Planctomycetota bacterium]|nr:hypothetical protein [Planctomycetota bacterium]